MNLTFDVVQHSRSSGGSTLFAFDISSNDCFVVAQRHNTLDTTTGACQRQETATTAEKTAAAAAWSTAKSSTTDTKKREAEKTKQAADQRCTEHQDSLLCPVVALDLRLARNVNTQRERQGDFCIQPIQQQRKAVCASVGRRKKQQQQKLYSSRMYTTAAVALLGKRETSSTAMAMGLLHR